MRRKISACVNVGRANGQACADGERGPPSAQAEIYYSVAQEGPTLTSPFNVVQCTFIKVILVLILVARPPGFETLSWHLLQIGLAF